LIADKKVLPAQREGLVTLFSDLAEIDEAKNKVTFSDKSEKSRVDVLTELFSKEVVSTKEEVNVAGNILLANFADDEEDVEKIRKETKEWYGRTNQSTFSKN
jgi:uncharacterized protein YdeI (BOF family)